MGFGGILGLDTLALVDMEHVVIPQERNLLLFAGFFIFLLDPFPEADKTRLLALFDLAASFLTLTECDVLARPAQQHLIQQGIGFAGRVADGFSRTDPRLQSGDTALLHLGDDPVSDSGVNIHDFAPSYCEGAGTCGRIFLPPVGLGWSLGGTRRGVVVDAPVFSLSKICERWSAWCNGQQCRAVPSSAQWCQRGTI